MPLISLQIASTLLAMTAVGGAICNAYVGKTRFNTRLILSIGAAGFILAIFGSFDGGSWFSLVLNFVFSPVLFYLMWKNEKLGHL